MGTRLLSLVRAFFSSELAWLGIYLLVALIATSVCAARHCNNFLIFRSAFSHLRAGRDLYASYVNELFLTALEKRGREIVLQFSFGAEPLPFETGSRVHQQTIAQVAGMIARHPKLRFQCFLASRHANQAFCTLARELPNFSLAGFWWHNFGAESSSVLDEKL